MTEGLWKKKPVMASAVGGIPAQVIHKQTGMLCHSVEGAAYQIRFLLSNPNMARRLGENGHEHVREHFSSPVTSAGISLYFCIRLAGNERETLEVR